MIFPEDSSTSFYSGPGGSVDASVWKPHPSHTDLNNHNSKLNTWAPGTRGGGNKDFVYDDASAKAAWNNGGRPDKGMQGAGSNAWAQPQDLGGPDTLDQELFNNLTIGKPGESFVPAQWGRQEINQATPWEVDPSNNMTRPPFGAPEGMPPHGRGFMQQPMHFDNGGNQWRGQWDNDGGYGNKGPPEFNGPPFPGSGGPMPGQFHGGRMNNFVPQQSGFNDRMPFQIRNGPPFHHGHHQPPQQPWMENKFNNGGHHQMHHPMSGPNNGGRFPFNHPGQQPPSAGPPNMMMPGRPPLLPMQPPHHQHHPPAGISNVAPNFPMGTFQPNVQNDDSMWQDPNGELRKWQRDTGTAVWGDPAKQNSSEIRRWLQPPTDSDEENILTPDPLREGKEEIETGWGPPPAPPGQKNTMAQIASLPGAWSEPPRGPPPANFGMPPAPNNFHQGIPQGPPANGGWGGAPPQGPVGGTDWTRSGPPNAGGFQQPPPMSGFDNFGQHMPHTDVQFQTRRLADKLRMAVGKGLLDMDLLANISNNSTSANLKLLNDMFDHVAQLETYESQIKQLEMNPTRKVEFDQLQAKIAAIKNELAEDREKIHAALSQKPGGLSGNPRVSLADELTSLDHGQPNELSTPLGGDVGPLW